MSDVRITFVFLLMRFMVYQFYILSVHYPGIFLLAYTPCF